MKLKTCDNCQIRYRPERNVSYRHRNFCGFSCKEAYIDVSFQLARKETADETDADSSLNDTRHSRYRVRG
jgi:hypothetical protein